MRLPRPNRALRAGVFKAERAYPAVYDLLVLLVDVVSGLDVEAQRAVLIKHEHVHVLPGGNAVAGQVLHPVSRMAQTGRQRLITRAGPLTLSYMPVVASVTAVRLSAQGR